MDFLESHVYAIQISHSCTLKLIVDVSNCLIFYLFYFFRVTVGETSETKWKSAFTSTFSPKVTIVRNNNKMSIVSHKIRVMR